MLNTCIKVAYFTWIQTKNQILEHENYFVGGKIHSHLQVSKFKGLSQVWNN